MMIDGKRTNCTDVIKAGFDSGTFNAKQKSLCLRAGADLAAGGGNGQFGNLKDSTSDPDVLNALSVSQCIQCLNASHPSKSDWQRDKCGCFMQADVGHCEKGWMSWILWGFLVATMLVILFIFIIVVH
jgi:hypothetical protein